MDKMITHNHMNYQNPNSLQLKDTKYLDLKLKNNIEKKFFV